MLTAIVRPPTPSLAACALTFVERAAIDADLALRQHAAYAEALRRLGARVLELAAEPTLPDATFVEDTAVVLDEVAVITRPGAAGRRAETDSMARALAHIRPLRQIEPPGILDGGDVLRIGHTLFVGRSTRTNDEGITQLHGITGPLGYDVVPVAVSGCLHLKTACTAIGDAAVILNPAWIDPTPLASLEQVPVPADEPWGANVIRLGETLLLAEGHPGTRRILESRGLAVETVDIGEMQKAEAGVTCLSLIFQTA